jgi:Flp pilus assembly pilin Flp
MTSPFVHFLRDEGGTALSEYALVTGLFALATIVALQAIGTQASSQLARTQTQLTSVAVSPP